MNYDVVTIRMSRSAANIPWGFSIRAPGIIRNVEGGSLADKAGLQNGDLVDELQYERRPSYERLQDLMQSAKNELDIIVMREPSVARIWQPTIQSTVPDRLTTQTPRSNYQAPINNSYQVSFQHQPLQSDGMHGFNQAPRQFDANKPTAKLDHQTPAYLRSEALKLIQENEKTPPNQTATLTPECFCCGRLIIGLMCQAFDKNMHPDCFQCSTCGSALAQQGHHFINEKFYCNVHGNQRRNQQLNSETETRRSEAPLTQSVRPFNSNGSLHEDRSKLSSNRFNPTTEKSFNSTNGTAPTRGFAGALGGRQNVTASYNSALGSSTSIAPPFSRQTDQSTGEQRGQLLNHTGQTPRCEFCNKDISGSFVLATGKTWCQEHFRCANAICNRQLLDCGFVEEDGKKYCEKCFETLIAPACAKCGLPITADCLNALQRQWHPECFTCQHCRRPFGNTAFYLENGQPYCEKDWNQLFTTKCVSCKFPIEAGDRWIEAIGSAFHSNCFNCHSCNVNLEGQNFYARDGHPFCRAHS